jgi:hypothetical protein
VAPLRSDSAVKRISLGRSVTQLDGPWKFTIGDSPIDPKTGGPLWAEPGFDDAHWETLDLTADKKSKDPTSGWTRYVKGWTARGHTRYWGYAWYRITLEDQEYPGKEPQQLAVWDVDDAYQLFTDGKLSGTFGTFKNGGPPSAPWNEPEIFDLSERQASSGSGVVLVRHVLAFRIWCGPGTMFQNPDGGGLHVAPVMGSEAAVKARYQGAWLEIIVSYAPMIAQAIIFFVLSIAACSLIFFDPSDRTYLWISAVLFLTAANAACTCLFAWTPIANQAEIYLVLDGIFSPLILGGWVMTWWFWFRLRRPTWVPTVVVALTLLYGFSNALGQDLLFRLIPHSMSAPIHLFSVAVRLSFLALLILIVIIGVRKQKREGWLALPAVVLVGIAQFQIDLLVLHIPALWFPFGVGIGLSDIASVALSLVIFILLLRRLQQSLQRQRLIALDLKQAQEVQQVLLPESRTLLPGLTIESEYRPAREVGGDFFQMIPNKTDGSLLVVAGDVTGKGLKAGMLVALLVGAIRSTAEWNSAPENVLSALNRRLLGRSEAQATCIALRIADDGAVTLVNAGHLPPYLNGEPVAMEGALPLGILEDAEFSVTSLYLNVGDRLVLVSDGVAEATDVNGNLFGFEQVRDLLRGASTAAELAAAAQTFGQEDDISVIALTRTPIGKPVFA